MGNPCILIPHCARYKVEPQKPLLEGGQWPRNRAIRRTRFSESDNLAQSDGFSPHLLGTVAHGRDFLQIAPCRSTQDFRGRTTSGPAGDGQLFGGIKERRRCPCRSNRRLRRSRNHRRHAGKLLAFRDNAIRSGNKPFRAGDFARIDPLGHSRLRRLRSGMHLSLRAAL